MSEPEDAWPVGRSGDGFVLRLSGDERELLVRLLGQLRQLLTDPVGAPLTARLFPVVHPDHHDREEEYQRLMRHELVTSRLAGIDTLESVLTRRGRQVTLDEGELLAFAQAVNSVRLVLGTLMGITDDNADDADVDLDVADEVDDTPEGHLYGYLSWVLESAVHAMSEGLDGG